MGPVDNGPGNQGCAGFVGRAVAGGLLSRDLMLLLRTLYEHANALL